MRLDGDDDDDKSADHAIQYSLFNEGDIITQWVMIDLFFTITFFFSRKTKTKKPALCDMLRHFHDLYSHRP